MPGRPDGSRVTIAPYDYDGELKKWPGAIGDMLRTPAGTYYEIVEWHRVVSRKHPKRYRLRCIKLGRLTGSAEPTGDLPGPLVWPIKWYPRGKQ